MTADTRQQLYDRIRETSKDEVILEEMIRYGFWPAGSDRPNMPEDLIRRRGELQREISDLARQSRRYADPEQAIKEIMKERMRLAREKRVETKRRQAQQRHDKAKAWADRRRDDVVHLGDTGSKALSGRENNIARLETNGLPAFDDMKAIANAMGIAIGELRFLAYDRKAARTTHYKRFQIAKKTGGMRTVSAPMPRLKRAQYWLLDNVLSKIEPHDAAHGFRVGRSIMSNAEQHINKTVVINLDLKDFFPSINFNRVKGLFKSLGYAEAQAAVFALLATEANRTMLQLDGEVWHIAEGERALPQGAPTSPAITNLLCRKLDRRLAGAAKKYGFTYTRYADDLTFSSEANDMDQLRRLMQIVRHVIREEGLTVNEDKTRIMRKGARQEVTGLTVNNGLSVSRKERRKFRAYLHQTQRDGVSKPWRAGNPANSALGFAQFLTMVHGTDGGVSGLAAKARAIFGQPAKSKKPGVLANKNFREVSAVGASPRDQWWEPARPAEPELPKELVEAREEALRERAAQGAVPRSGNTRRSSPRATAGANQQPFDWWQTIRGWRVPITVLAIILSFNVPGGYFAAAVVIYFLWFYKK